MIIELDTVIESPEATAEDAGRTVTAGFDVTFTVAQESGPAGGHPVLRFEGEEAELRKMVHAHYGPDAADIFTS
jgi:hypothetical protein